MDGNKHKGNTIIISIPCVGRLMEAKLIFIIEQTESKKVVIEKSKEQNQSVSKIKWKIFIEFY